MMRRAKNTWEKLGNIEPELQDMTAQMNGDQTIDHYWWRRMGALCGSRGPRTQL